jgi:hypothetical protein
VLHGIPTGVLHSFGASGSHSDHGRVWCVMRAIAPLAPAEQEHTVQPMHDGNVRACVRACVRVYVRACVPVCRTPSEAL